uniref:Capsid protein n=1 Tax=Lepus torque teno virus 1 TaxID=2716318 RepID=A0A6G7NP14_9VIRU|nr:ORF1 [Lepus torque teno virus 1]
MRYYRRRRGRRRGFRRRWRRRGYHRRRFTRRRFGRGRRRRKGRRVRWLFEYMPRFFRRCVIRGWWPVLATGYRPPNKDQNSAAKQMSAFKPQTCFGMVNVKGWFYGNNLVNFGGYSCGTFSLSSLYQEHLMMRNRWSQSNCGFDLASYRGTKIMFVPHPHLDYLVYIDSEYRDFSLWMKQCMHPAVLLTHPNSRLIRSIAHGGPRRKLPRIFVPPPSTMNSGWSWMKDLAGHGLFAWFVCWLDLHNPFFAHVEDPNDVKWWDKGRENEPPSWYADWFDLQQMAVGDQIMAVYGENQIGQPPGDFKTITDTANWPMDLHLQEQAQCTAGLRVSTDHLLLQVLLAMGRQYHDSEKICNPEQDAIRADVTFLRNFEQIKLEKWKLKDSWDNQWGQQTQGPQTQTHWKKWKADQERRWHGYPDAPWPDLSQWPDGNNLRQNPEANLQKEYSTTSDGRFRNSWDPDRAPQWRPKH